MKIQTKTLKQALKKVAPAVSNSPIVPILECVLIEVKDGMMILKTSDLRDTIITQFECSENEGGKMAISHKDLNAYINLINEPEIEISYDKDACNLSIKAGKAKSKITGENPEDYPSIQDVDGTEVEIDAEVFHTVKNKIIPFASTDELKPAMCGVKLGEKCYETTDGHQMSRIYPEEANEIGVLLTTGIIKHACSLFESGKVKVSYTDSNTKITDGNQTVIGRNIEERFPNTDGVIANRADAKTYQVDRSILLNEIRRITLFSNKITNSIKVTFGDGVIEIEAQDLDTGKESKTKIEADGNAPLEIGLEGKQVEKALSTLEADTVSISHFDKDNKSIWIEADNMLILTMPVLLANKI